MATSSLLFALSLVYASAWAALRLRGSVALLARLQAASSLPSPSASASSSASPLSLAPATQSLFLEASQPLALALCSHLVERLAPLLPPLLDALPLFAAGQDVGALLGQTLLQLRAEFERGGGVSALLSVGASSPTPSRLPPSSRPPRLSEAQRLSLLEAELHALLAAPRLPALTSLLADKLLAALLRLVHERLPPPPPTPSGPPSPTPPLVARLPLLVQAARALGDGEQPPALWTWRDPALLSWAREICLGPLEALEDE